MIPKKIAVQNSKRLSIIWEDGTECSVALEYLREQCPCAHCKGEPVMLAGTDNRPEAFLAADAVEIRNIKIVGSYAAMIEWKDGHDKGLYTWEYLRVLAENECQRTEFEYQSLI